MKCVKIYEVPIVGERGQIFKIIMENWRGNYYEIDEGMIRKVECITAKEVIDEVKNFLDF